MGAKNSLKYKKWISVILSFVFAFAASTLVKEQTPLMWLVVIVNGCLIYLTALGGNTLISSTQGGGETLRAAILQDKSFNEKGGEVRIAHGRFRDPWLPPPLPHTFYGALKINDSDAPVGTRVEARGTGVTTGIVGNPIVTTADGKYGSEDPFGQKLVVQGDIAEGATIEFYINGIKADQTAKWHSSAVTKLDLTVTTAESQNL